MIIKSISYIEKFLDAYTSFNSEWQSNGESGRKANRRNLVRGVGNVTTSLISCETNGSVGMHNFIHNKG